MHSRHTFESLFKDMLLLTFQNAILKNTVQQTNLTLVLVKFQRLIESVCDQIPLGRWVIYVNNFTGNLVDMTLNMTVKSQETITSLQASVLK